MRGSYLLAAGSFKSCVFVCPLSFYEGSIENLPIESNSVNIVISNGAINLASSKEAVFSEIFRVLVNGGHLYFSNMIKDENNFETTCCNNESWADGIAGTLRSDNLIQIMERTGFIEVKRSSINNYKTSRSTIGATFTALKG